jgi:Domain of unknown function (DUF4177)
MKTTIKSLLVSACAGLLLVGCATKTTDSCCDDGSTNSSMKTVKTVGYEYKIIHFTVGGDESFEAQLNAAGKDGWKLVSTSTVSPQSYLFERQKQ